MESFISLSPDMSGPPSPPLEPPTSVTGLAAGNLVDSNNGGSSTNNNGQQGSIVTGGFVSATSIASSTTTAAIAPSAVAGGDNVLTELTATGDVADEEMKQEDEDEAALRQSGTVVEGLQQMDLLSLVLDLMERVSGGSVTAKTVDNEAGIIRARIARARASLQMIPGLGESVDERREEMRKLEDMIQKKRDLLLKFQSVMGATNSTDKNNEQIKERGLGGSTNMMDVDPAQLSGSGEDQKANVKLESGVSSNGNITAASGQSQTGNIDSTSANSASDIPTISINNTINNNNNNNANNHNNEDAMSGNDGGDFVENLMHNFDNQDPTGTTNDGAGAITMTTGAETTTTAESIDGIEAKSVISGPDNSGGVSLLSPEQSSQMVNIALTGESHQEQLEQQQPPPPQNEQTQQHQQQQVQQIEETQEQADENMLNDLNLDSFEPSSFDFNF